MSRPSPEQLEQMIGAASSAPSAHNTQPWAWEIDADSIRVLRAPDRTLEAGDPTRRETFLSLGMFIEALVVAAADLGFGADVNVVALAPANTEVAVVDLAAVPVKPSDAELAAALPERHTDRGAYIAESAPGWLRDVESTLVDLGEVNVATITNGESKAAIADLVAQGTRVALALPKMRRELAALTYWDSESRQVGMPIEAMAPGVHPEGSATEWTLEHLSPEDDAARMYERYATPPVICVVSTRCDDPAAWIAAGRASMRILLRATVDGLAHCITAAPVEVPTLLPSLRFVAETGDARPQMVFRLGRPEVLVSCRTRRLPVALTRQSAR